MTLRFAFHFPTALAVLLSLLLLHGCGPTDGSSFSFVARDSAGIQIVESNEPSWGQQDAWRVAGEPALELGRPEDEDQYQLFFVEDAVRLSDGSIVVANGGTAELLHFDPAGRYQSALGGRGRGPGEFESVSDIIPLPGDSTLVTDRLLGRLTTFDPHRRLVEVRNVDDPLGRFADGTFVLERFEPDPGGHQVGMLRDWNLYVRSAADGNVIDTLARLRGTEEYRVVSSSGGLSSYVAPFGLVRVAAIHGDRLFTGDGTRYEISVYRQNGALERLIRRSYEQMAIASPDRDGLEQAILAEAPNENTRRTRERLVAEWQFPAYMPAYRDLTTDVNGNLWVEDYRRPGDEQPRWSVFARSGEWLGTVETPIGLEITDIGDDYIVGVSLDQLDRELVQLFRLIKPDRPGPSGPNE